MCVRIHMDLYFSPASFVRYKWTKYEAANNPRAVFSLCRFRGIADESLLLVKRHQRWLVLSLVDRLFKGGSKATFLEGSVLSFGHCRCP